jgi:phospholipid transport system transporter-binding protein
MEAKFESVSPGRFRVSGPMTFATVTGLLRQSADRFAQGERAEVDLAEVEESDSAGLALLIEWKKIARRQGGSVRFTNMPPQLTALARISEVDELLNDQLAPAEPVERATG